MRDAGPGEEEEEDDDDGEEKEEDGKDGNDDEDEDDEDEKEAADGKAFDERRHADDRAADGDEGEPDARTEEDREKMVEMLRYFTPEQMDRYECFRRSSLPKPALRRLFQTVTNGTILNPNGLIVLAAVGKLFVGELVEAAREIADRRGVSDLEQLKPSHLREAHAKMQSEGRLFKPVRKKLFGNHHGA